MSKVVFEGVVTVLGLGFMAVFAVIVVPPLLASGDVVGAAMAGFVNPFATGYSLDTIICGLILITWIIYERITLGVRHGWICIVLSLVPGVATGFALYLILRMRGRTARPDLA